MVGLYCYNVVLQDSLMFNGWFIFYNVVYNVVLQDSLMFNGWFIFL